jgi:hypothetical protein
MMRSFVVLAAIFALTGVAGAQTPQCKSISDSAARLACFDKQPAPAASSTAGKPASSPKSPPKADAAKYVDSIAAEDKLMNARLKNICRGC